MTARPATKEQFKDFILRALGEPLIKVNVTDEQIFDRIEEGLRLYYDYHFDGSFKVYYKKQLTQADIDNRYITIPENIMGAVRIFNVGTTVSSANNLFGLRYQIMLNDLYTLTSQSMVPYYTSFSHLQMIEQLLVGEQPIRYNRHMNKLYVDMDWNLVKPDQYMIVEAYEVMDPETYQDVWNDRWLKEYITALVKKQWGQNLSKFQGIQMAGGVTYNGDAMKQEADGEIQRLREELERNSPILMDFLG